MRRTYLYGFLLLLLTLSADGDVAFAQGKSAPAMCNDFPTILLGMRDARQQLSSGVCRGTGLRVLRVNADQKLEGECRFLVAFDNLNRRFRCDREEPILIHDSEQNRDRVSQIAYQSIKLPDKTIYRDDGNGSNTGVFVVVEDPDYQFPIYGRQIDVRAFGLAGFSAFDNGAVFEAMADGLERAKVLSVARESDGRCSVLLQPANDQGQVIETAKINLWINCEQGFSVERYEMRGRKDADDEWSGVLLFSDVSWAERKGVWVPTSIYVERHFNGFESYQATLDWESVNEAPSDEFFEPEGFGVPRGSPIVDDRLDGKSIPIRRVGMKETTRPIVPKTTSWVRIGWMFAGNLIVFVAIAAFVWLQKRPAK